MQMVSTLGVLDYLFIILLAPFFAMRLAHWTYDRVLVPDKKACKLVDAFKSRFQGEISHVEIRPCRHIAVLHLLPRTDGPSNGLIIFIHGSCARMQQFAPQIRRFHEAGYEVLSYDALGCGESRKPVGESLYKTRELYEDFVAFLRNYTVDRKTRAVSVVGHSFGGALVSKIAATTDARSISKSFVSLCQPSCNPDSMKKLAIFKLPLSILWLIRPLLGIKARDLLFGPKAGEDLRRQEKEASARNPVHMFRSFYKGTDQSFFDPDVIGKQLHVPVLFVAGEHDRICPPSAVKATAKKFESNSEFVLARACGHQCMQEDPDQVNDIIQAFLSRLQQK